MKSLLCTLFVLGALLLSCKKESTDSGNGSLAYRSSYEYPLEIRPVGFVDRLVLENATPYSDILGQVLKNVSESTKMSDVQVSNIHASSAVVYVSTQDAFMDAHLTNSRIVFKDGGSETTVATFSSYSNSKINYSLSGADLTSVFKNSASGSFYIHFDFDSNTVPDDIKVYYDIFFDYDYSMKQYKK